MNDPRLDRLIDEYVIAVERQEEGHPSRVALRQAIHDHVRYLVEDAELKGMIEEMRRNRKWLDETRALITARQTDPESSTHPQLTSPHTKDTVFV